MRLHGDDFLSRARAKLDGLRARDGQLAAQERGIVQKRAELAVSVHELEAAIAVYERLMDAVEPEETAPGEGGGKGKGEAEIAATAEPDAQSSRLLDPEEAGRMTISDAAEAVLKALGGEADTQAILKELTALGKVGGANPVNTLSTQLRRFPQRFQWVRRGRWRLIEHAESAQSMPSGTEADFRPTRQGASTDQPLRAHDPIPAPRGRGTLADLANSLIGSGSIAQMQRAAELAAGMHGTYELQQQRLRTIESALSASGAAAEAKRGIEQLLHARDALSPALGDAIQQAGRVRRLLEPPG